MITWWVEGTEDGDAVGSAVDITALRNWAAQLDESLPVFFDTSPWEGGVSVSEVPAFVEELQVLMSRSGTAPDGTLEIIRSMLAIAESAQRNGKGIDIGN